MADNSDLRNHDESEPNPVVGTGTSVAPAGRTTGHLSRKERQYKFLADTNHEWDDGYAKGREDAAADVDKALIGLPREWFDIRSNAVAAARGTRQTIDALMSGKEDKCDEA